MPDRAEEPIRKTAFDPVVRPDTRVLVLGSLPGDASLAASQYYAHPRNQFWPIAGGIIGGDLTSLAYPERLSALLDAGIGLWDTVASARRSGSLDAAMRDVKAAELCELVGRLPQLRAVAFNGSMASRTGRSQLGNTMPFAMLDMPSTSPAYCAVTIAEKQLQWNLLRKFLL